MLLNFGFGLIYFYHTFIFIIYIYIYNSSEQLATELYVFHHTRPIVWMSVDHVLDRHWVIQYSQWIFMTHSCVVWRHITYSNQATSYWYCILQQSYGYEKIYVKLTKQKPRQVVYIHSMCVMKARRSGCVPFHNKTHSSHYDVIKWKHFHVAGHLCGEFTGPRWIPRTKASDAELWYFLWSASE